MQDSASVPYSTTVRPRWQATWRERTWPPVLLAVLTLLYFWPQLVRGRALYWGDIGLYFLPMQVFLRQNLLAGRVPLWNPLILCGTPYVGNPQTWPLYPVSALLPFVSAPYFLNLTVALHVWLAGVGTWLFARRALGVGTGAALLAAVTFMFGGQFVSKEQFPNMVQAMAWLPWVLWALDRTLRARRVRDALTLGLVLGLQLLAAHVQMTVLTLYLAAAWAVFRGVTRRGSLFIAGAFVVGCGLAAGQILPTLALFRDAARQRLTFEAVNRFYLPWDEMTNPLLPRRHGHPFFGDWAAHGNLWETCCYVGWVPFALAAWGGVSAWRRRGADRETKPGARAARFWTGVFVVGFWMALGRAGGLYHGAYWVLPGFRSFHDPARCLLPACFALSLLAAWGWEALAGVWGRPLFNSGSPGSGRGGLLFRTLATVLALALAFADLAHFGRTLYPLADPAALSPVSANVARVLADPDIRAGQARIIAPTDRVWVRFTSYKDYEQDVPGYQQDWADTLTSNLTMAYGLPDAFGYEPVGLKDAQGATAHAAWSLSPQAGRDEATRACRVAGKFAVKYVAVCRVVPPERTLPGLVPVRSAPTLAPPGGRHMGGAAARIFLSRNALWLPRAHLDGSPRPVALSDGGPDRVTASFSVPPAPPAARPAWLLLADTRAPGWEATLDGRAVPIHSYDFCLRAVAAGPAGPHRVVFSYRPTAYLLGLYLSLLAWGVLAGALSFAGAGFLARRGGLSRAGVE